MPEIGIGHIPDLVHDHRPVQPGSGADLFAIGQEAVVIQDDQGRVHLTI